MILQKVRLAKLKTDDGHWDYSSDPEAKVGQEMWIRVNSFTVMSAKSRKTGEIFKTLMVRLEDGQSLAPAVILEYLPEFRVEG